MRGSELPYRLFMPVVVAILSGCGGGLPAGLPLQPGNVPPSASLRERPDRAASWMAQGIKQRDLLYVSNGNGFVSVFRYWQHTLVGVLTDFTDPSGECADFAGNVYVADLGNQSISEYAHGSKKPVRVIKEKPAKPYDCAVSPSNGNLAIANFNQGRYTPGAITVYPHGNGQPITYEASNDDHFVYCAYDDRGDLLATSKYYYYYYYLYDYKFYYLPKNGSKLIEMKLQGPRSSGSWDLVADLAWDGKYWIVDSYNELYQFSIDVKAKLVGSTKISGGYNSAGPIAVYRKTSQSLGTQVAGGRSSQSKSSVEFWKYPSGGDPIGSITKDLDEPSGLAISLGIKT